ncbi:soluble lytic murein transglycosylase [Tistlia consotensis]|uniref:Soluble lytic murein transglycosylase n=1 Tax=Tistlia consotensis USBA 355 TaxID=560819 RepID=A0A1Y6BSB0_9PROT|nr:lytic transglycosylase domain-containing protein [Tistlia consotensis]SMF18429.1 soluble lytic murein transglycosylase [Tistlia consotensis USBA 355]SNR39696.1 soluble lytic murein transglycosylase [Tistlia consotensis]
MRTVVRVYVPTLLLALVTACLLVPANSAGAQLLSARDRQIYHEAFDKAEHGQWAAALALSAQGSDPLLAKVLRWDWLRRDDSADFASIVTFLDKNPNWPGSDQLQRQAERAMPPDLPDSAVIAWFAGLKPLTAEGGVRYAEALARRGLTAQASELARSIWRGQVLNSDLESRLLQRFGGAFTRDDDEARLTAMLLKRADDSALRVGKMIGSGHQALAAATVKLYNRSPGVDAAIERVPPALRDHPRLVYERARWRLRSGMLEGAVQLLESPYPPDADPDNWWALRRWAAREALSEGMVSSAYRIAANHGTDDGLSFAEGEFLAGWIALRFLKEDDTALKHFERLYKGVSSPISRARGAYWAGEAERAAGREQQADKWYRLAAVHDTTFYGQLAAHRLGGQPAVVGTAPHQPDDRQRAAFEARELPRAIRELAEIDANEPLPWLFAGLRAQASDERDWRLIAELARSTGHDEQVVRTAKLALRDGIYLPDLLYPPPPHKVGQDLEGALVAGLMRQESEFDVEATSPSGALGLMQLMPSTAREVAGKLGVPYHVGLLTGDPGYNMKLGRAYLSRLLARTGGYVPMAVASYNAGPGNVDRWLRFNGDPRDGTTDPVDWIESIPFTETRNYVQRVIEGAVVYARRMGLGGDPIAAFLYGPQTRMIDEKLADTTN